MGGRATAAAAAAVAALALAGGAQAATVAVEPDAFGSTVLVYRAAAGEQNLVTATVQASSAVFEEAGAPLAAGDGCTELATGRVSCAHPGVVSVLLGDGDDRYALAPESAEGASVSGGAGHDELDGVAGVAEGLDGGDGDDAVSGGARGIPAPQPCAPLTGCTGGGGDFLRGGAGDDRVAGGATDDHVEGGAGDDALDGGGGLDALDGGDGNDLVRSADARAESPDCGPGADAVAADLQDAPDASCEQVVRCGVGGAVDGVLPGALDCVRGAVEG